MITVPFFPTYTPTLSIESNHDKEISPGNHFFVSFRGYTAHRLLRLIPIFGPRIHTSNTKQGGNTKLCFDRLAITFNWGTIITGQLLKYGDEIDKADSDELSYGSICL
jgi:hypothetical protein